MLFLHGRFSVYMGISLLSLKVFGGILIERTRNITDRVIGEENAVLGRREDVYIGFLL